MGCQTTGPTGPTGGRRTDLDGREDGGREDGGREDGRGEDGEGFQKPAVE